MLGRVLQRTRPVVRAIRCRTGPAVVLTHRYSTTPAGSSEEGARDPFSANPIPPDLMKVLVCPLSKEPLRYDGSISALVCDKLSVAYPIIRGVPSLVPQDGRVLPADSSTPTTASGQ